MTEIVMRVRGRDPASVDSSVHNVHRDLADLGVRLAALYPGASDPELQGWFLADMAAGSRPEEVVRRLLEHPDVEAAYEKPQGAPPLTSREEQ